MENENVGSGSMLKTSLCLTCTSDQEDNPGSGLGSASEFTNVQPSHRERVRIDYSLTGMFADLIYKRNLMNILEMIIIEVA